MVGFAATATYRTAGPPLTAIKPAVSFVEELQVKGFEKLSGPPVMVFQDLDDPPHAATFGDCGCAIYKAFGAVGLITNGPGRDLEGVRRLEFPVFANGAVCAHGYTHIPDIHVPVRVGGVTIYPNDLLHGDLNGVTTIPHEIASELVDIADEWVEAEKDFLRAQQTWTPSNRALHKALAEFEERIEDLRARVSHKR